MFFSHFRQDKKYLFYDSKKSEGSILIVKNYLDDMYGRGYFLRTLERIAERIGGGDEYSGCMFPEEVDPVDDEAFDKGVRCWYLEDEVIVSEQELYDVMSMACQRYIELNPKSKEEVENILSKWRFTTSS